MSSPIYTVLAYTPSFTTFYGQYLETHMESGFSTLVTASVSRARERLLEAHLYNIRLTDRRSPKYKRDADEMTILLGKDGFFGFDHLDDCQPRLGSVMYSQDAWIEETICWAKSHAMSIFLHEIEEVELAKLEKVAQLRGQSSAALEAAERETLARLKQKYE